MTRVGIEEHDNIVHSQGYDVFVPTKPETLREVFVEKADALRHSDIRNAILEPALREGLLMAEGPRWKHDRRALAPVFTPRHINTLASAIQYIPFGLGPRVCIGARFAVLEALIMIVRLARAYRFELVGEHPWPHARVTVRPEETLRVRVVRR